MQITQRNLRILIIGLLVITLLVCPLSVTGIAARDFPIAHAQPDSFTFVPSVPTLEVDAGEADAEFESVNVPTVTIEGNTFRIGNMAYPIGDKFADADGIPLASVEQSLLGDYGYATILARGAEGHRLIWVTDRSGEREYMIVPADHALYSGEDGFTKQLDDLKEHETHMRNSIGALIGATGTVVAIDLGLCPVSLGAGCAKAGFTALIGGIGAAGASLWFLFHDVVPAQRDVLNEFSNLDLNLP